MDSFYAFAMGEANRGKEHMVFDWYKVVRMIIKEKPDVCCAGLRNDWEWTGGCIYNKGKIVKDNYMWLSSTWAVPELNIDGKIVPCFKMESETPGWSHATCWPESAKRILNYNMQKDIRRQSYNCGNRI